ncbi:MAG: TRAP transporter large permease [Spirochaeta sp.]|jgi:tripartite ATP-independent transporter DctM subunit|nr:TRAP transporter large permease [Spirochaeta sp.]
MNIDGGAIAILLVTFFSLTVLGTHVAFAMISAAILTTMYLGFPLLTVMQNLINGINGFAFLAIPFFILAGQIMSSGGISERLVQLSNALVGWMRGGLALVNILASMFFGGISGSATADTASLGSILIPMMKKNGYDGDFSTTVTMASSVQGLLVPPSHNMVIFALAAGGVSIGRLFMGGLVPGIFLGIALMVFSYVMAVIRQYPKGDHFALRELIVALRRSILGLGTIFIVVIGVVTGVFTATESAAIAVIYAFIVTFFIYREIPLREFWTILGSTMKTLSMVLILIAAAGAFGWCIAFLRIPTLLAQGILGFTSSKVVALLIINVILLVLGTMMGMASIIVIMTPILLPIVMQLGMDPVQFGVIMILNCGIGLLTPPVGGVLFVGSAVSGIKVEYLSKAMLPFYAVMFAVLMCITFIPGITMFLPNLLMP